MSAATVALDREGLRELGGTRSQAALRLVRYSTPADPSQRSASSADWHPIPAAVTAWR